MNVVGVMGLFFSQSTAKTITSITIPDGITSISDYAFDGCESLESIVFSKDIVSIGDEAFLGCKSLSSLKIPKSVTKIGKSAFKDVKGPIKYYGSDVMTKCILEDGNIENLYHLNCNFAGKKILKKVRISIDLL